MAEILSSPSWHYDLSTIQTILRGFEARNGNGCSGHSRSCLACNKFTRLRNELKQPKTSAKGTCAKIGKGDAFRISDPLFPRMGTFHASRKILRLAYFDLPHLGPREEANKRLFKSLLLSIPHRVVSKHSPVFSSQKQNPIDSRETWRDGVANFGENC